MLVPTPSPTQPSPLYVTVNVAVVLSEDRATLAVTCEPNAFVFDASEALGAVHKSKATRAMLAGILGVATILRFIHTHVS